MFAPNCLSDGLDLVAGDVETGHLREIERHAILAHLAADRDHLGDAGNGQETRPNDPVDHLPHLHGTRRIAGNGDEHDLAHDGCDRGHLRVDVARQLLAHHAEPLGDLLAVEVDVGAPIELDVDDRQADARHGAHPHDAGHAVHGRLQRERDELLHLLGRKAFSLGDERDGRPVEIGKDVDRQVAQRHRTVDDENERGREHEQPVAKASRDEEVEHGLPSLSGSG